MKRTPLAHPRNRSEKIKRPAGDHPNQNQQAECPSSLGNIKWNGK